MTTASQFDLAKPISGLDKTAAVLSHGSLLLGIPLLLPLGVLLFVTVFKPSAYAREQSLQALVFHFLVTVVFGGLVIVAVGLGVWGLVTAALSPEAAAGTMELPANWWQALLVLLAAMAFLCWASIVSLIATVKAFQGKPYNLPLVGRFF